MAFDLFTLRCLAGEIERHLRSKTISAVESGPSHLALSCGRSGQAYMALGANGYLCHLPDGPKPEGRPLATGDRYLRGATVEAFIAEERDRVVRIRLSRSAPDGVPTYGQLVCELIHPNCQAYLIREQNAQILAHWWTGSSKGRKPRLAIGEPYQLPRDRGLLDHSGDVGLFGQRLDEIGGDLDAAIVKALVGVDRATARELVFRAGCRNDQPVAQLEASAVDGLWTEYRRLAEVGGDVGYTWRDGDRSCFSVIEPTHQPDYNRVDSINAAVVWAQHDSPIGGGGAASPADTRDEIGRMLATAGKKIRKRLEALGTDLKEAAGAEELAKMGNTLMANLHTVPARASSIRLADVFDPEGSNTVLIELDPRKSAADNGQWFLKRASKLRRRLQDLPGRIEATEAAARKIDDYASLVEKGQGPDPDGVRAWLSELRLIYLDRPGGKKAAAAAHPRTYTTSSGWTVLAGRNNNENDQLTHRLASPDDVWFHAHGYAGSHVVLRREDRQEEPGVRNLEEAAGIAAFWSKGKTAKKVPVIYTHVKYVSKPRGGAPGQALVRREKTLMVEPRLPVSG